MKMILIALSLLSSVVYANDCKYKYIGETNNTYVYPIYVANVTYYFSKKDKEARAMAHWTLNEKKTIECFNIVKAVFSGSKVSIPTVFASNVEMKVLGASDFSSIEIFPTASGHWSGTTSFNLPYSIKNQIMEANQAGQSMVEFKADTKMRIKIMGKKTYGKFNCTEKEEGAGVIRLHERLGAFKKLAESLKGADTEDVLQTFLGTCVEFKAVNAESLTEFNEEQKKNSKILKNQIEITGNVEIDSYLNLPAVAVEDVSIFDT